MPLLTRDRLSAVAAGLDHLRLLCVTGPAGSGKSTLMAQWHGMLADTGRAWISLESSDAEPAGFVTALAAALMPLEPELCPRLRTLAISAGPDLLRQATDRILTDLAPRPAPVVLFLDDAHHLIGSPVEEALARLATQAPPGLTLVIGSRDRLRLPLARMTLAGTAAEVPWDDLRFTADEAAALLERARGGCVSPAVARAVAERTEGWVTGLQLAAIALRDAPCKPDLLPLSGRRVEVVDYLLEGVFSGLSRADRDFLMHTSVLDRFDAGLAAAVTGRDDSRATLERLEQANLFLLRLDDRRQWFRYHHLFQEFLQDRLEVEHPDHRRDLLRRAAEWCAEADLQPEAMTYALRGGHLERLADLLCRAGRRMFRQGDFKALHDWLAELPRPMVESRRDLCVLSAWAHAYLGEFGLARQWAQRAETGLHADDTQGRAELAVMRAALGVIQTDEPETRDLSLDVADHVAADEPALLGFAHVAVGYALRSAGRLKEAVATFEKGVAATERPETALVNLLARFNISTLHFMMGRQVTAERYLRASLAVASERGWERTIGAGFLSVQLGIVLREQNRLAESLDALSHGVTLLQATEAFGFLGVGLAERARTHLAGGDRAAAEADVAAAKALAEARDVTRVGFRVTLMEARLALGMGRLDAVQARLAPLWEAFGPPTEDAAPLNEKHEVFLVEWCRLLLRRGSQADVVRLAGLGVGSALAAGRHRNAVSFLVLQAAAWKGLGAAGKVRDKVVRAVDLVRGEACVRAFLVGGPALLDDLAALAAEPALGPVVAPVLAGLGHAAERPAEAAAAPPLHYRETQIIGLLTHGLRNREIAERLRISEETVKWYLKQLYEKLGVRSRTEAVQRAREMNLIG